MTSSPDRPDDASRLEVLGHYEILDTEAEQSFDDVARLAAYVCGTPSAFVTLIDAERQWFKARFGWELIETEREIAFCAHTILGRGSLVVEDTLNDPRFATNPLVTGAPGVRFYAGVPLLMPEGHAIGSLAVIDYQPRTLDPAQLEALRALARQVVTLLELRKRRLESTEQARDEMHAAVERFELVSRATNDAVWDWDLVTNLLWWNENFQTLFGYAAHEVGPDIISWTNRLHPDDLERVKRKIYGVIDRGGDVWSDEYRFRRADGTYADIFDRGYVHYERGKAVRMIGAMMDISERRRLERQLHHTQKLDAIGQLSGGIAHDFNNMLTVIQCNATILHRRADHADSRELTSGILEASERASNLTRQLLMMSRKQVLHVTAVDINAIVVQLSRMLRHVVGTHIQLVERCNTSIPPARGDAGMIEQVLLNLVVNARDAMPRGGTLTIETGEEILQDSRTHDGIELTPGVYVWMETRDTGSGIAPDVLPHIFEPFFTTKEVGKGTGLGLATAYGILRQQQGWITVTSEPERGATFRCYLPASNERPPGTRARETTPLPIGKETLLVVEDEAPVRKLVVDLLESCGYTVLAAASGPQALDLWSTHRAHIALLLTDVVMSGGMTGHELAARLRADNPRLAVIYMSGYSPEQGGDSEPLVPGENFLQKPFASPAVAALVRSRLDDRDP